MNRVILISEFDSLLLEMFRMYYFIYVCLSTFSNSSNSKWILGVKQAVTTAKKNDMKTWHDILRADGNVFTEVITVILVHSFIPYIFWGRLKLKIWFALLLSNIKDSFSFN